MATDQLTEDLNAAASAIDRARAHIGDARDGLAAGTASRLRLDEVREQLSRAVALLAWFEIDRSTARSAAACHTRPA